MANSEAARHAEDYAALHRRCVDLQKQVDHLSILREIGHTINATIDRNLIMPPIARVVKDNLDVRKLTLYTLEDGGKVAKPEVGKHGEDLITKERFEEEEIHVQGTPLGEALENRRPVIVTSQFQSEVYIPLVKDDKALGVMHLEEREDGRPFDAEDVDLYQNLGSMIAIAIDNAELYAKAVNDGLTGLFVRRYFDLKMSESIETARRYKKVFSLMMFDIDHFKKFNDTHGHQTGDMVLKEFARLLQTNTRGTDICCRYGGEEMCVILPETGLEEGTLLANKLCETIRGRTFTGAKNEKLRVTTSVGVGQFREDYQGPEDMVDAIDKALYRAKDNGRDRVELAESPS